jgi:hypothetical protein
MGNGIYFKIAGYVDLDVLIILIPCQIFDIINGFWVISQNQWNDEIYQLAKDQALVKKLKKQKI